MDRQETIADIIAERRQHADELESKIIAYKDNPSKDLALETLALSLVAENRNEADRLEKAHRRERGDVAKLREALSDMLNAAFVVILRHGNATEEMGRLALCADNARDALATEKGGKK